MFFTSWLTALLRERKRNTNQKAATRKRFYHRTGWQQIDLLEDRTMLSAVAPRDLLVEAHAEDPQESATESEFAVSLSSDYLFEFQKSVTDANNNTYVQNPIVFVISVVHKGCRISNVTSFALRSLIVTTLHPCT